MPFLHRVIVLPNVSKKVIGWYLLNFETCGRWDPGIESSIRLNDPLPEDKILPFVGDEYKVTLKAGNVMTYKALEVSQDSAEVWRIVLESNDSYLIYSKDTITVKQIGADTEVSYEADIRFKGLLRFVEYFIEGKFEQIADDAMSGLKKASENDSMIKNPPPKLG